MYLLIVILLTGQGTMSEPFVAEMRESECKKMLPAMVEVVQKQQASGFVVVCVPVSKTPKAAL
jgi:hypothetical protein